MEKQQYICPKCGNRGYESDQFQATGGNLAKLFDVQNKNLSLSVVKVWLYRIVQSTNFSWMECFRFSYRWLVY